jgi:hypothetical protein
MVTTPIINEPFTKITMDIAGPLNRTKSGKKYILTIIDSRMMIRFFVLSTQVLNV